MAYTIEEKNAHSETEEFSKNLTNSKRSPIKKESDRGKELFLSVFQNALKVKNSHPYSRF